MKYTHMTKFRRILAAVLLLAMMTSLTGCWKKDKPDSTEPSTDPVSSTTLAPTTQAPTEAPTQPTTEAPTEAPTQPTLAPDSGTDKLLGMATVDATKLNIRGGAGYEYDSVGYCYKGDRIAILQIKGEWAKTSKGWINLEYITLDSDVADKPTDKTDTTNKTDKTDKTDKDTTTTTTSKDIVSDGKTKALGYGVVTLGTLNVRSGPGTNYDKVGTVSSGSRYAYYQRSGNWARIKNGWISVSYFYLEGTTGAGAGTGTISGTTGLNIRSGPDKSFNSVGSYKENDSVKVLAQVNGWGYTGKGWISMKYVKMDGTVSAGATGTGVITADSLNIRKSASNTAEKVGSYVKGDKVKILEVSNGWGKTDKGWISMAYVDMDESTIVQTKKIGTITASSLHIRKEPDKTSESLGAYVKDDKVEILEVSSDSKWGKTDKGWISMEYVKLN